MAAVTVMAASVTAVLVITAVSAIEVSPMAGSIVDTADSTERRHFHGRGLFFGPFVGFGAYGGSCYWNCRQYHGPRYCHYYSDNYCY